MKASTARSFTSKQPASEPHRPVNAPLMQEWSCKKGVKTARGMNAFTLSFVCHFLSPLISSHDRAQASVRGAPGCLPLICCDINFKCLLALKARQQIHSIKVNGAFYSTGLWNRSYRLQRKLNTLRPQRAGNVEDALFGLPAAAATTKVQRRVKDADKHNFD